MKSIIYFVAVLVITTAILAGLFFYNKGQTKELSAQLKISDAVTLDITRGTARPMDAAKYHVILYVKAKNNTNATVDLSEKPLTDPCANLRNNPNNYNYNQTYPSPASSAYSTPAPTSSQTADNYLTCTQGPAYQAYSKWQEETRGGNIKKNLIELWTPQNQKCDMDGNYTLNKRYPNLAYNILSQYEANQSRIGTLVYTCPENAGNFSLQYNDGNVTVPL